MSGELELYPFVKTKPRKTIIQPIISRRLAEKLEKDRTYNSAGIYTDENNVTQFYDNEVDHYNQDHYQLHWNEKYNSNWSSNIALHYTYGRGYFEQFKEDESFSTYGFTPIEINGDTIENTDIIRRRWLDNDFYGTAFSLNYKENNINFVLGGAYNIYKGDHFGEVIWARYASTSEIRDRYYDNEAKKTDFNTYLKGTIKLSDAINIYADAQIRHINYKTEGINSALNEFNIDDSFTFFNPKIGLNYTFNTKNELYFSYARANREPNRTDYENGKPKPEQLNDFELGWRLKTNKALVNTNIYYMAYTNQLVLTGALDDVGAPLRENSGNSFRFGIEIDSDITISKAFSIQPNISVSTNKNKDFTRSFNGELVHLGNTNISYSPNAVVGNIINYTPIKNLNLAFLSKYVAEQYMSNFDVEQSKLKDYFVNDFSINYTLKPTKLFESITFSGLVNNVFGEKYVSNGYYFSYDDTWSVPGETTTLDGAGYYPQATTNFLAGVTLKF